MSEVVANGHTLRLEWRSPSELAENPRNWRTHPQSQIEALEGVVSEVGWAGACLYNEATGRLIDGHARRKIAQQQGCERVPVLVGSWTEEQEAKILATLDPIAGMAEADPVKLEELLRDVQTSSQAVADLLAELWEENKPDVMPDFQPGSEDDQGRLDEKAKVFCPECGHEFTP